MAPMLRGENGNPGSFELLWGEIDDASAAIVELASKVTGQTFSVPVSPTSNGTAPDARSRAGLFRRKKEGEV